MWIEKEDFIDGIMSIIDVPDDERKNVIRVIEQLDPNLFDYDNKIYTLEAITGYKWMNRYNEEEEPVSEWKWKDFSGEEDPWEVKL
jgi:hypothetical protein